jgi:hypothetical protein
MKVKTLGKNSLFWDVEEVDPKKHSRFVIERVLNFGDREDFTWLREFYGEKRIKEVVLESRNLNAKSQNFWCGYFNINPKECTRKLSTQKQSMFGKRSSKVR